VATDGSTPLKYTEFLSSAGGNHRLALQSAIDVMFGGSNLFMGLDMEGAVATPDGPVRFPDNVVSATRSVYNGEIKASQNFSGGSHILDLRLDAFGKSARPVLRFNNLTFNGSDVASWVQWDAGNFFFNLCHLKNPQQGDLSPFRLGAPGLHCQAGPNDPDPADAGLFMSNCWITTDDSLIPPTQRTTVGIRTDTGDQKFSIVTGSYFRHTLIINGRSCLLDTCHFFQGVPSATSPIEHTASIKLTRGTSAVEINNHYLDNSFIEISNEDNPNATTIGALTINQMHTAIMNQEEGFAWIVVRDYHDKTNLMISDIMMTAIEFYGGTAGTMILPTRVHNPRHFDLSSMQGVVLAPSHFNPQNIPQANPLTMQKTFSTASTKHSFSFAGRFPFGAKVRTIESFAGNPTSGGAQPLWVGNVDRANNLASIDSRDNWAGTISVTATCNSPESNGIMAE
jgi:hypothetical protein